jgi:uncharacterized OB-fold protein
VTNIEPPAALAAEVQLPESLAGVEPVQSIRAPARITYTYTPGTALSTYLRAMGEKRILGDVCPATGQVFVPPRGISPLAGAPTVGFVELADRGYVESFCITRVPLPSRPDLDPPFVSGWILLDGASVGFLGLVLEIDPEDVRIGLQVEAMWKPDDELAESAENILGWRPTGEPDHEITSYEGVGT